MIQGMLDRSKANTPEQWMHIIGLAPTGTAIGDRTLSGSPWLVGGATLTCTVLKLRSPWLAGGATLTDTADSALHTWYRRRRGGGGIAGIVTELEPLLIACLLSISLT